MEIKIRWTGKGKDEKAVDISTGKTIITVNPKFYRPAEVDLLIGDFSKAKQKLKWEPKTSFNELVSMMVKSDYATLK